jgi:hypothetical protein
MSHKQIKLQIFPDGQVKADVVGFQGKKCADYISVLEQLLDAETTDSEWTADYYLEESLVSTDINLIPMKQTTEAGS